MKYCLIFQIFEDIWIKKQNIVESRLNNIFGNSKHIYARKCEIIEFNAKNANICSKFIENNHIQGNVGSSFKFGLMYEGELGLYRIFDVGCDKMMYIRDQE